jgi:hypothetical protein
MATTFKAVGIVRFEFQRLAVLAVSKRTKRLLPLLAALDERDHRPFKAPPRAFLHHATGAADAKLS